MQFKKNNKTEDFMLYVTQEVLLFGAPSLAWSNLPSLL